MQNGKDVHRFQCFRQCIFHTIVTSKIHSQEQILQNGWVGNEFELYCDEKTVVNKMI